MIFTCNSFYIYFINHCLSALKPVVVITTFFPTRSQYFLRNPKQKKSKVDVRAAHNLRTIWQQREMDVNASGLALRAPQTGVLERESDAAGSRDRPRANATFKQPRTYTPSDVRQYLSLDYSLPREREGSILRLRWMTVHIAIHCNRET